MKFGYTSLFKPFQSFFLIDTKTKNNLHIIFHYIKHGNKPLSGVSKTAKSQLINKKVGNGCLIEI